MGRLVNWISQLASVSWFNVQTIWERQKREFPGFADYEAKAGSRTIPVIVLEPR